MTKKLLNVLIAVAMVLTLMPLSVISFAATCDHSFTDDSIYCTKCGECMFVYDLTYTDDWDALPTENYEEPESNEIHIKGCINSSAKNIVIPETIDGYPVTAVSSLSYYDLDSGENDECNSFETIEIPDTVKSVYCGIFENTAFAENEANWENGVLYADDWAVALSSDYKLYYDDAETEGTTSALDLVIREGTRGFATNMFDSACFRCINIPATVCDCIDSVTFSYTFSVEAYNVAQGNEYYTSVDGVLFSKDMSYMYYYPVNKTGVEYVIPDGVKVIGWMAFCGSDLESIIVSEGVEIINDGHPETGNSAFGYCTKLTNVELPSTLKYIGMAAFEGCDVLENLTIPASVDSIGSMAFPYEYSFDEATGTESYSSDCTIYGVAGSYAQTYANENGYKFVAATEATAAASAATEKTTAASAAAEKTTAAPAADTTKAAAASTANNNSGSIAKTGDSGIGSAVAFCAIAAGAFFILSKKKEG